MTEVRGHIIMKGAFLIVLLPGPSAAQEHKCQVKSNIVPDCILARWLHWSEPYLSPVIL